MILRYRRAVRAGNSLLLLKNDGFEPDLICASSSMPGSLFIRDVFPKAFYVVEADWFYTYDKHTFFDRNISPAEFAPARIRNFWEYNSLGDCDLAFTSSSWQKSHYPDFLAKKIHVVHHGVNTAFFRPSQNETFTDEETGLDLADASEIVSFSGPYWDPVRGFPQFLQAVPQILKARPHCHIIILWPDRRSKVRSIPNSVVRAEADKLGRLLAEISLTEGERARVHLLGVRPLSKYRMMLRVSTVHVYLTAPHALSSGFLEAMACGALVVGSDTAPVREVLSQAQNGFLCDYVNPDSIASTVIGVLEHMPKLAFMREAAQKLVAEEYSANMQADRLVALFRSGVAKKWRTQ